MRSFTTDDEGGNFFITTPPRFDGEDLSVITNTATSIISSAATLNLLATGEYFGGECNFIWGTSPNNMPFVTESRDRNLDGVATCSERIFGLSSNTTYYYQGWFSGENGLVRSFTTNSSGIVFVPIENNNVEQVVEDEFLSISKFVSLDEISGFSDEVSSESEDLVYYKIKVVNNTGEKVESIKVTDYIPFFLELDEDESIEDLSQKEIVWANFSLEKGEIREFVTELKISKDVRVGDEIISSAKIEYDGVVENTNDVIIKIEDGFFAQGGLLGFGLSGLGLFIWFILIILLLIIAYLLYRLIFFKKEEKKEKTKEIEIKENGDVFYPKF